MLFVVQICSNLIWRGDLGFDAESLAQMLHPATENRGEKLLTGCFDSTAKLWEVARGRCLSVERGQLFSRAFKSGNA
jgi:hypothetical protein